MSYNHLLDQGIDPDDWDDPEDGGGDEEFIAFIDWQSARVVGMSTEAIRAELASLTPDMGQGVDEVRDVLTYELMKRGEQ